jgi:formamidopyrimidine-DNA glycosylase
VFRRKVIDRLVQEVGRVGKRVILLLDSGDRIVFEPRMTGLVLLADPPSSEHLRFRLDFSGDVSHVWYWDRRGLGNVRLLSPAEFHEQLGPHKLGTDALALAPGEMRERLSGSRRAVKVALLDQQAIAGIDGTYRNALNKAGGHQNHHRVYDRAGHPCLVCRTGVVQRIVQAQRATFFCSVCQPKRVPRKSK